MNELESLVILSGIPFVGTKKIRLLLQHFGSAKGVIEAPLDEISTFPGFGPKTMDYWKKGLDGKQWKQNLLIADQLDVQIIPFSSPAYPARLLEIDDYPLLLYVQGTLLKEDNHCLAIVGTRGASIYGLEMAKLLSSQLAEAGFTIVSGFARGIDTAAHEGALEKGRTFAVLGSGLGCLYPAENKNMAKLVREQGALISEFPMEAPPEKHHFPRRNRIVSGMTLGTILIEAPRKSGAMLTADLALAQGRPVFALPGRADQSSFNGNHALIKEGKAALIETVEDILKTFQGRGPPLQFIPSAHHSPSLLGKEERELLERMPAQEISIENLAAEIQWPIGKLNSLLMSLVLKKMVKEYPGKIYKKYRD